MVSQESPSQQRSSAILRGILSRNPEVNTFTVERILASIETDSSEVVLMVFSIPAIVPVASPRGTVAMPAWTIAGQLVCGRESVRLPSWMLRKSVSRRSLAVAIHAILPVLEAAERVVRPRWSWSNHPIARRAIGFLLFLLALAIACPLGGFKELHAIAMLVVSLGMAEQDGLAVMIGVVAGVLSLLFLALAGLSARALRAKVRNVLRRIGKKLGLGIVARFLERLGYKRLARLVALEWSDVVLTWDPEKRATERAQRVPLEVPTSSQRERSSTARERAARREQPDVAWRAVPIQA